MANFSENPITILSLFPKLRVRLDSFLRESGDSLHCVHPLCSLPCPVVSLLPSNKMIQRSAISLCKSLSRYPFQRSSIPSSCFILTSLSNSVLPPKHMKTHHHVLLCPTCCSTYATATQFKILGNTPRQYSSSVDTSKVVDEINLKFAEARDEIETALESKETVYFNEEAECARDAVKEVLDMYEGLLARLSEKERGVIQRSMGLKIEQLKAELQQLNE